MKNFLKQNKTKQNKTKQILVFSLFIGLLALFWGCKKSYQTNVEYDKTSEVIPQLSVNHLSSNDNSFSLFKMYFESYKSIIKEIYPSIELSNINLLNTSVVSFKKLKGEAITLLLDSSNNRYTSFVLTKKEGIFSEPKIVTVENHDNIKYFDLESDRLLSLTIHNKAIDKKSFTTFRNGEYTIISDTYPRGASGCGQKTMDCVSDAYSNHGWLSVWATIQSAVIWQTSAAIVGVCAAKNCLN